jgi:DNA-binding protein H-NS
MDLLNMKVAELRALEEKIKREIKKRESEEITRAREEIMSIAQKLGISLKEIIGTQGKAKNTKSANYYQHPEDASRTWSGRGRKPGWIKEWLESGKTLDSLRT